MLLSGLMMWNYLRIIWFVWLSKPHSRSSWVRTYLIIMLDEMNILLVMEKFLCSSSYSSFSFGLIELNGVLVSPPRNSRALLYIPQRIETITRICFPKEAVFQKHDSSFHPVIPIIHLLLFYLFIFYVIQMILTNTWAVNLLFT